MESENPVVFDLRRSRAETETQILVVQLAWGEIELLFPLVWPQPHFGVSANHKYKLFPLIPRCWDLQGGVHWDSMPVPGPM